ncbi:MAG TPA: GNAT family N-acetyltransferase [Candidatus Limnocylindrales bacterium]|nr:GNAT family N-acetyltransferase [Candidatus Limnocylindrales bacterium]
MTESARDRVEVPVLETPRLLMRGHRPDDLEFGAALWSNPDVVRYVGGKPLTQEEVWARMLRYVGHWAWMGYGLWIVEEKTSRQFIGEVGFANHKRDTQPSFIGEPELGWVLAPSFQGKGYATEAVRTAMVWGSRHFGPQRTVCMIHPENGASLRVAEKCGFREWQRTTYKSEPTILLRCELARPA